jgi:CheY-like chemotaxis protein
MHWPAAQMKKVLIADDTKMMRQLALSFLGKFECAVVEAENGREALDLARQEHPDLILLDVSMPEMDGPDVLRALREDPTTQGIPAIMMTGHTSKAMVSSTIRLGVRAYLTKPLKRDRFEREMRKWLPALPITPSTG